MMHHHADTQRRTLRLLFTSQALGSVAVTVGMSVGALLAAELVSVGVSGLAQSAAVLGAAILAVPASRLVRTHGRRPSLAALYAIAAVGGVLVVMASRTHSVAALFTGFFLFGGGSAASFQARFAAADLAPPDRTGRHISLVVWASTIGGILGPNLAPVAARTLSRYDVPTLAAPFVVSTVLLTLVALFIFALLRPDPMLVAQAERARVAAAGNVAGTSTAPNTQHAGLGDALRSVFANPAATLGLLATAGGHVVMVAVMSMTPVHIMHGGSASPDVIRIVGIVISIHIAGMFAFSPVMGWLSDRIGRQRVILGGVALLLTACAIAGTAGHDAPRLAVGLFCLGLGWSATMVSGSALLSSSLEPTIRPAAQGLSDLVMGLAGASAGALAGIVVQAYGYPALTLASAIAISPLLVMAVRASVRRPAA